MSKAGLTKRNKQGAVDSNHLTTLLTNIETSSETGSRIITWDETAEWQRDNKYLIRGYRRGTANVQEILTSLTFVHNETCNVYTHLIGAILLPFIAAACFRLLAEPSFSNVTNTDYIMFWIYFLCAEGCLLISTSYHLNMSHSAEVEQFWLRMDLLGIVIMTIGTFVSGINYIFACEPNWTMIHWAIIVSSGSANITMLLIPRFRKMRTARTCAFIALGASAFIPLLHGVQRYGWVYMIQYSGMRYYLIELSFYGSGVILYAFRFPECLSPGTFDIVGASHQIFHVCILSAIYSHLTAMKQGFVLSHTLDVCKIKAEYRATNGV